MFFLLGFTVQFFDPKLTSQQPRINSVHLPSVLDGENFTSVNTAALQAANNNNGNNSNSSNHVPQELIDHRNSFDGMSVCA